MSPVSEYLISSAIKARHNPNVVSYKKKLLLQLKEANEKFPFQKEDTRRNVEMDVFIPESRKEA